MQQHSVHIVYVVYSDGLRFAIRWMRRFMDVAAVSPMYHDYRFGRSLSVSYYKKKKKRSPPGKSSLSYSFGCCGMRNCDDELRQAAHSFSPVCRPSSSHFFFFFAFVYNYYSFRYLSKMAHTHSRRVSSTVRCQREIYIFYLFIYSSFFLELS